MNIWVFPKIGETYPKMDGENNGKPENPIKMDDLGVPLFSEISILLGETSYFTTMAAV